MRRLLEQVEVGAAKFNGLSATDAETVAAWAEAARERGPVLFVGAGWSANAQSRALGEEHDLKRALLWNKISQILREALDSEITRVDDVDPLWLAELYRQRHGHDALVRVVREAVPDQNLMPGPLHEALRSIRWRSILTTNYDRLLEKTFEAHIPIRSCVEDADLVSSNAEGALEIIHLHGVIERPETIVLAYEDYRRYPARHRGMLTKVRQLFLQHPVMFLGFGLTDPNFLQWSGWLSDIAGRLRNPWLALTIDPAPSLPHSRYWGSRLHFVSLDGNHAQFQALVPRILSLVEQTISRDDWSERVAFDRIQRTARARDTLDALKSVISEARERRGFGREWHRAELNLYNAAASHVLDLNQVPWREKSGPVAAPPGIRLSIDARPIAERDRSTELVSSLTNAFGREWPAWCKFVCSRVGVHWLFERIDLQGNRPSDVWNQTVVTVDPTATTSSSPANGAAPDDQTGISALDSLRRGEAPEEPKGDDPASLRMRGYLCYQRGDLDAACEAYAAAAQASRGALEPLRTYYLTVQSELICLQRSVHRKSPTQRDAIKKRLDSVSASLDKAAAALQRRPEEERLDPILGAERNALARLSSELLKRSGREDIDRVHRFGDVYGPAAQWADTLEALWLAPPLLASAIGALGALQMLYGNQPGANMTLARYGSPELQSFVSSAYRNRDTTSAQVREIKSSLLLPGRWPAEWLSRAEGIRVILSDCTVDEIVALEVFCNEGRKSIEEASNIFRGSTEVMQWSAGLAIELLDVERFQWLAPSEGLRLLEKWATRKVSFARDLSSFRCFVRALDRIPWAEWGGFSKTARSRLGVVFARMMSVVAKGWTTLDSDTVASFFDSLVAYSRRAGLDVGAHPPLLRSLQRAARGLSPREARTASVILAELVKDTSSRSTLVRDALAKTASKATTTDALRMAIELVGTARKLPRTLEARYVRACSSLLSKALAAAQTRDEFERSSINNDVLLLSFSLCRILSSRTSAALREVTHRLVQSFSMAAEYFAAVAPRALGVATAPTSEALLGLLQGTSNDDWSLSRREKQFSGLRGVARCVGTLGGSYVERSWLVETVSLSRVDDLALAQYATWLMAEWVKSMVSHSKMTAQNAALVEQALIVAAHDNRVPRAANGICGLSRLQANQPTRARARLLSTFASDDRVAIVRALAGAAEC